MKQSALMPWASPRLTWQVINGAALLAHTPAKPTLARYTRSLHTIQLAQTATACKDAAHSANTAAWSRPIGHWRRLLEACAREVSEAGRIAGSRCFQACFRARPSWHGPSRGQEGQDKLIAAETRARRTWIQLCECSGEGRSEHEVGTACMRIHTGMQGGPSLSHSPPPMSRPAPRASCGTARHMRSMCGLLRDGAVRGETAGGSGGQGGMRLFKNAYRAARAVGMLGGLSGGGLAACETREGQQCSCVLMVQSTALTARERAEGACRRGYMQSAHRRAEPLQWLGGTQHSPVCAPEQSQSRSAAAKPMKCTLSARGMSVSRFCYRFVRLPCILSL